jgi:hypothetical protein
MSYQPLEGDPKRQAIPALRGYIYQIWHTVLDWITLEKDEVLYIEGAEDIDRIGGGKINETEIAEAKQIKSKSKNITLKSKDVADSIVNYWRYKEKNDKKVFFRLVTTSSRGIESGEPFEDENGDLVKGLDLWDNLRSEGDLSELVSEIENILDDIDSSSAQSLSLFIQKSSDDQIRNELLKRISWDTECRRIEEVKDRIKENLIRHGKDYSIPPSESVSAINDLLHSVSKKITSEDIKVRSLTWGDFEQVFEKAVSERVSSQEYQALSKLRDELSRSYVDEGNKGTEVSREYRSLTETAPPQEGLLCRESVVTQIENRIEDYKFANLHGVTGRGKSVTARFVADRSEAEWYTLSLRGFDSDSVRQHLRRSAEEVRVSEPTNLILDDISLRDSSNRPGFSRLVRTVWNKGGSIMITSRSSLQSVLLHELALDSDACFEIPSMDKSELEKFIQLHKADTQKIEEWATDILLATQGNPQLSHARILYMSQRDWPESRLLSFEPTESEEKVLQDVRDDLRHSIPSEDERELLYRTSIFFHSFTRDRALYIAESLDPVDRPGESLDLLIGPYIENEGSKKLRLSLLFSDSTDEHFSTQKRRDLHAAAGESLFGEKITPIDLRCMFMHSIMGYSSNVLSASLYATHNIPDENWQDVAEYIKLVSRCNVGNNNFAFLLDLYLSFKLRRTQLQIADILKEEELSTSISEAWWQDIRRLETNNSSIKEHSPSVEAAATEFEEDQDADALRQYATLETQKMLLLSTIAESSYPRPAPEILAKLTCDVFSDLCDKGLSILPDESADSIRGPLKQHSPELRIETIALDLLRLHNCGPEDWASIIENIEEQESCSSLVETFENYPSQATSIVDQIWMHEVNNEHDDWKFYLNILDNMTKRIDAPPLRAAICRAKAVVESEHLDMTGSALSTLNDVDDYIEDHDIITSYKITTLSVLEDYDSIPSVATSLNPSRFNNPDEAVIHRDIGIANANLENWEEALSEFEAGSDAAASGGLEVLRLGFKMEKALVEWERGDRKASVDIVEKAADGLKALPDPNSSLKSFALHKLTDATINYMLRELGSYLSDIEDVESIDLYHGIYTELTRNKQLRELPLPSYDFRQVLVSSIRYNITGLKSLSNVEIDDRTELPVLGRVQYSRLNLRFSIDKSEFSSTLLYSVDYLLSQRLALINSSKNQDKSDWTGQSPRIEVLVDDLLDDNLDLVFSLLGSILIAASAKNRVNVLIKGWRKEIRLLSFLGNHNLSQIIDYYETVKENKSLCIDNITVEGVKEWQQSVCCASLLGSTNDLTEEFLAELFCFLKFSQAGESGPIGGEILECLETHMTSFWMNVLDERRFMLRSPMRNAEHIRRSCNSKTSGIKKIASILDSCRHAVNVQIRSEIKHEISHYIDSN